MINLVSDTIDREDINSLIESILFYYNNPILLNKARLASYKLGEKFDIRAFHDTVLGNGGVTLAVLEQQVDAWIARVQAGN